MKIEIDDTVLIDAMVEQWQARLLKVHTPANVTEMPTVSFYDDIHICNLVY